MFYLFTLSLPLLQGPMASHLVYALPTPQGLTHMYAAGLVEHLVSADIM